MGQQKTAEHSENTYSIWNFILLLAEGDSAIKVAFQITSRELDPYKPVAY